MDRKEILQARLAQNDKDIEALQLNGGKLELELADLNTTYSIGDRFRQGNEEYMLTAHDVRTVCMTSLEDGNRWRSSYQVEDVGKISIGELKHITGSTYPFTKIDS